MSIIYHIYHMYELNHFGHVIRNMSLLRAALTWRITHTRTVTSPNLDDRTLKV